MGDECSVRCDKGLPLVLSFCHVRQCSGQCQNGYKDLHRTDISITVQVPQASYSWCLTTDLLDSSVVICPAPPPHRRIEARNKKFNQYQPHRGHHLVPPPLSGTYRANPWLSKHIRHLFSSLNTRAVTQMTERLPQLLSEKSRVTANTLHLPLTFLEYCAETGLQRYFMPMYDFRAQYLYLFSLMSCPAPPPNTPHLCQVACSHRVKTRGRSIPLIATCISWYSKVVP